MSQSEILKMLEECHWVTTKMIQKKTKLSQSVVAQQLLKLLKQKLIERKRTMRGGNNFYYYRFINSK